MRVITVIRPPLEPRLPKQSSNSPQHQEQKPTLTPTPDRRGIEIVQRDSTLQFHFDAAYGEGEVTPLQLYDAYLRADVERVADGGVATVISHGPPGPGRQWLYEGSTGVPGLLHLSLKTMVELSDSRFPGRPTSRRRLSVAWCEIHNDSIKDLLGPEGRRPPRLAQNPLLGPVVENLLEVPVKSVEDASNVLLAARRPSSRSAQTLLYVMSRPGGEPSSDNRFSSFSFVPVLLSVGMLLLADIPLTDGPQSAMMPRTAAPSLAKSGSATLHRCVESLEAGSAHVPYHRSRITSALSQALSEHGKTAMFLNVPPGRNEQEMHVALKLLRFGAVCSRLPGGGNPLVGQIVDPTLLIGALVDGAGQSLADEFSVARQPERPVPALSRSQFAEHEKAAMAIMEQELTGDLQRDFNLVCEEKARLARQLAAVLPELDAQRDANDHLLRRVTTLTAERIEMVRQVEEAQKLATDAKDLQDSFHQAEAAANREALSERVAELEKELEETKHELTETKQRADAAEQQKTPRSRRAGSGATGLGPPRPMTRPRRTSVSVLPQAGTLRRAVHDRRQPGTLEEERSPDGDLRKRVLTEQQLESGQLGGQHSGSQTSLHLGLSRVTESVVSDETAREVAHKDVNAESLAAAIAAILGSQAPQSVASVKGSARSPKAEKTEPVTKAPAPSEPAEPAQPSAEENALKAKLRRAQNDIRAHRFHMDVMERTIVRLKGELEAHKAEVAKAEAHARSKEMEARREGRDAHAARREAKQARTVLADAQTERDALREEVRALRRREAGRQKWREEASKNIAELQSEREQWQDAVEKELADAHERLDDAREIAAEREAEVARVTEEARRLRDALAEHADSSRRDVQAINRLEQELQSHRQAQQQNEQDLQDAWNKVSEKEKALADMGVLMQEAEFRLQDMREELDRVQGHRSTRRKHRSTPPRVTDVEAALAVKDAMIAQLRSEVEEKSVREELAHERMAATEPEREPRMRSPRAVTASLAERRRELEVIRNSIWS